MKKLKFYCEYIVFFLLCIQFEKFSPAFSRKLATNLGDFARSVLGIRKSMVRANLKTAFPSISGAELDRLTRNVYRHFCRAFARLVYLGVHPEEVGRVVVPVDFGILEDTLKKYGNFIIATGHIGEWEIGGLYLAQTSIPVSVLAKRQTNPLVADRLDRYRCATGGKVIYRGADLKKLVRAIKQGRVPVMVADQDGGPAGIRIESFGKPLSMNVGLPALSHRYQLPVVPVFAITRGDGMINLECNTPIQPSFELSQEEFTRTLLERYNRILDATIRKYPDQYFWFHKRWKTGSPEVYFE